MVLLAHQCGVIGSLVWCCTGAIGPLVWCCTGAIGPLVWCCTVLLSTTGVILILKRSLLLYLVINKVPSREMSDCVMNIGLADMAKLMIANMKDKAYQLTNNSHK